MKKIFIWFLTLFITSVVLFAVLSIFFDEAVLLRKGTIYRVDVSEKEVALTFDDGPSPVWTPQILDELKSAGVKATFFMLGRHVEKYPEVARRVAEEGHEIGNHTYDHHVLFYYTPSELIEQIEKTARVIEKITGQTPRFFRPPKAWVTEREKKTIKDLGYTIVLWTLNSKDWVTFDDKYMIKYLLRHTRPGDIILFHDSGGAFAAEGGDRHETVLAVKCLIERLKERGYSFVTLSELLQKEN
jgi:peptidoglycan/xylan/chitin deacetylase (PgdA/CDA1 family)